MIAHTSCDVFRDGNGYLLSWWSRWQILVFNAIGIAIVVEWIVGWWQITWVFVIGYTISPEIHQYDPLQPFAGTVSVVIGYIGEHKVFQFTLVAIIVSVCVVVYFKHFVFTGQYWCFVVQNFDHLGACPDTPGFAGCWAGRYTNRWW